MTGLTKVLLIDNDPKFLEDVLPYYGYEVICTENEKQGL